MKIDENDIKIIIKHYGETAQKEKAAEELEELRFEVLNGGSYENIAEEMADVLIMIFQLIKIYQVSEKDLQGIIDYKLIRTMMRIRDGEQK